MNYDLVSTIGIPVSAVVVVFALTGLLSRSVRQRVLMATAFALWFGTVVWVGASGALKGGGPRAAGLGIAVLLPLSLLCVLVFRSEQGREQIARARLRSLIAPQILRVLGITFVLLYAAHRLPAPFAPVAGWGDVAIGLDAILMTYLVWTVESRARGFLLVWNVLGVVDLVTAITLGALSAPGPLQVFRHGPSSDIMTSLPLILIPCFLVPCFLFLHIATFYRVRVGVRKGVGAAQLQVAA
jgi:hypothetical protein